jgi:hypothetical protein
MVQLLEMVGRPQTLGFQADMAHTLLYILGYNSPEDAILPADWDWSDPRRLNEAMKALTVALRPWTIDFHVAQNDATVHGSGTHDKTGHHCMAKDPNGKLTIPHHAGYWLHGDDGKLTKAFRHICWDGCMFPNAVMMQQQTWNDILGAMIAVRDAHGWREEEGKQKAEVRGQKAEIRSQKSEARSKRSEKKPLSAKSKPRKRAKTIAKKATKKPAKKSAKKPTAGASKARPAKKPAPKKKAPTKKAAAKKLKRR